MQMMDNQNTLWYRENDKNKQTAHEVLEQVYVALKEKGYNPVNQIVGYLISGDPTYITSHMGARKLIAKYERDELMEELVQEYLKQF